MLKNLIFILGLSISVSAHAQELTEYSYRDEAGGLNTVTVISDENVMVWEQADGETPARASFEVDPYESLMADFESRQATLIILSGSGLENFIEEIKDPDFIEENFNYIQLDCMGRVSEFLLIMNHESRQLKGYCLYKRPSNT